MASASPARISAAVIALSLPLSTCTNPLDLCPPVDGRVGFFSRGDCVFTRASFFSGHEWITFLGNEDLSEDERFSEEEIDAIVEGNRRTDFPIEFLVYLNSSVIAYTNAVIEYQGRPENQAIHFLLDDVNDYQTAAADAHALMHDRVSRAMESWNTDRLGALTLLGQACHALQDSYSDAHTVRDPETGCVRKLKAFIPRAANASFDGIEFHGTDDDTIGHTTSIDSIYRPGRDCNRPVGRSEVEACLSPSAVAARVGTRDFLRMVRDLVADPADALRVQSTVDDYIQAHLALCDDV